jgi:hypothetical protein
MSAPDSHVKAHLILVTANFACCRRFQISLSSIRLSRKAFSDSRQAKILTFGGTEAGHISWNPALRPFGLVLLLSKLWLAWSSSTARWYALRTENIPDFS